MCRLSYQTRDIQILKGILHLFKSFLKNLLRLSEIDKNSTVPFRRSQTSARSLKIRYLDIYIFSLLMKIQYLRSQETKLLSRI